MWLILLDRSDSMGNPFAGTREFSGRTRVSDATIKLDAARETITEQLQGLGTPTRVVIIAFNNVAVIVYDGPSADAQAIATALGEIAPRGGTAIAEALRLAARTVAAAREERLFRALVVTDGEDELDPSAAAAEDLAQQSVAIDVALIDPTPKGEQVARAIARYGSVMAVTSSAQLNLEVARAKAAQESDQATVQAMIERHEESRVELAREKPVEERLAFTAAYPSDIATLRWYPLIIYLHLAGMDAEVMSAVQQAPGLLAPVLSKARATRGVTRGTQLVITPHLPGLAVNPPAATIAWFEDLQDVRFRILADAALAGQSVGGTVEITLGGLPIAHLHVAINIKADDVVPSQAASFAQAKIYQDIFASYAHQDTAIVQACRAVYWGLGIQLTVDKQTLRSGQEWDPALRAIIDRCDLFQLFWSQAASGSVPVREEYKYALQVLDRKDSSFIRPLVWEASPPAIPEDLKKYHFAPLDLAALSHLSQMPLSAGATPAPPDRAKPSRSRVPVAAVPLIPGAAPEVVAAVRADLSDAVHFLEDTTGLRYYPVPTLLVDEHIVQSVRQHETIDATPIDKVGFVKALADLLLAVGLEFHVHALTPTGRGNHLDRAEYAKRFGAGSLVTQEQFDWLNMTSEYFPSLASLPPFVICEMMASLGQAPGSGSFVELIPLVLEACARAVENKKPDEIATVPESWSPMPASEVSQPKALFDALVRAGGKVEVDANVSLTGTRRQFAELLRGLAGEVLPLLPAVDAHDWLRAVSPAPEAIQAERLCRLGSMISGSLLKFSLPPGLPRSVLNFSRWIEGALHPGWIPLGESLQSKSLAAGARTDTLPDLLQAYLGEMMRVLEQGLQTQGDFPVRMGFSVPEASWKAIVAELAPRGVTADIHEDFFRGREAMLNGGYADLLALYRDAATRLPSLLRQPMSRGTAVQRFFIEACPTFGVFVPSGSDVADRSLYRWAADQGITQALTLAGADRVLLCLAAAQRFIDALRQRQSDAARTLRLGPAFQRCILVHEHFHAALACALDRDGNPARGPGQPDAWAKAIDLNEALAAWMELHFARDDADLESLVWDYIRAGTYPTWPYAAAATIEKEYSDKGLEAVRGWIARLRNTPDLAQADFDKLVAALH